MALLAACVYFATIGRDDFYRLYAAVYEVIEVIAANYTKK
jgi:hypothetical protein